MSLRALCVLCGAHTLHLVVSDGAKTLTDAIGYFFAFLYYAQNISCTEHLDTLKRNVNLTHKFHGQVQHETVELKPQIYEVAKVRQDFIEVRSHAKIRIEASSLAEDIGSVFHLHCYVVCNPKYHFALLQIRGLC